ncbi:uncharacterized protein [Oscarella lobularis]|uniref:uncharacterized protein isoform X2 n=1 Tax=Oscarella lobularis TaxID=121494 RepID=UPI003313A3C5
MNALIGCGCQISAKAKYGDGALALASQKGHLDIARQLVEIGCSVNERHQNEYTALHWACEKGHAETADFLILSGTDIEALDKFGCTPFLRVVFNGHSEVMRVLIQRGCNLSAKNKNGTGALAIASHEGYLSIARILVEMGCSVNESSEYCNNNYTALHWACENGHALIAEFLISSGAIIEASNSFKFTPFLLAVLHGHSEVVNVLIRCGCSVSTKNSIGNGALALASQRGHLDIARQLVEMGCSVNESFKDGNTALHLAYQHHRHAVISYLLLAGADSRARNWFGVLPRQMVVEDYNEPICYPEDFENDDWLDDDFENDDRSQEIYDDALKRGSVTVNRSRVIVVGQDGAGKSCLVDSLLNRPFEKDKASTEGAAVAMTHTAATSGWVATNTKDHLDPLIAEGVYRMKQQQSPLIRRHDNSLELSYEVIELDDIKDLEDAKEGISDLVYGTPKAVDVVQQPPSVETLAEDLKAVGMEAKTLTANQQQLVNTFLTNRPTEDDLIKQSLGVRDIWDLGGQEIYLATHSAFMPDSKSFGLSMYMIVMDISKSLSDKAESFHRSSDGEIIDQTDNLGWICTNGDFPLYWFGSITAAHAETPLGDHWLGKDEEVAPPPVFAIGSHRDVLESDEKQFPNAASIKKWLKEQGNLLEQLLSDSDFMKHIVLPENGVGKGDNFREFAHFFKKLFLIDNSVSGSMSPCKGVKEIRDRVDRMTTAYWKGMKKQPLFWVYLEILLFRWSKVMKTVVAKVDEVAKLAQHPTICNISCRDEVLVALKFLANAGAILYYPEADDLKDVVFTRPMWVVKALSAFVTAAEPGPYMMPDWINLKDKGIMSNGLMNYRLKQLRKAVSSDLTTSLKDAGPEQIEEDNKQIVRLLELLDVITLVEGLPQTEFYVPSMLKTSFLYPSTYWERFTRRLELEPLCRDLPAPLIVIPRKLKFVPECLFFRLVTRFLKVYPNKPRLSRHQCIFLVQDKFSSVEAELELLYHKRGKWVALTIHFINEEDPNKTSKGFLVSIRNQLGQQMKNVCQQGLRGFKYSICCQIRTADDKFGIHLRSLPVIFNEDWDYSPKLPKLYNPFCEPLAVKQEEFFKINGWFEGLSADAIKNQDALPKEINVSLIRVVATLVKAKWEALAVCLGRNASDIPQYQEKSKENLLRAMMVIEDWSAEVGRKATVEALIQACEECGFHRNTIEAAIKEKLGCQSQSLPSPSQTKRQDVGMDGETKIYTYFLL